MFSRCIFLSESSWGDEDIQGKVGRLELNSYELHSTITGGFRLFHISSIPQYHSHRQIQVLLSTPTNQFFQSKLPPLLPPESQLSPKLHPPFHQVRYDI